MFVAYFFEKFIFSLLKTVKKIHFSNPFLFSSEDFLSIANCLIMLLFSDGGRLKLKLINKVVYSGKKW